MIKPCLIKTVDVLFEEQTKRTPNHIALVSDEGSITYKDLNERANQIAHYLKSQGIGSEKIVGLHLPRSIKAITAILATLKAGGAYLPLNLCDPIEALEYILKESQPTFLISQSETILTSSLAKHCNTISWNDLEKAIEFQPNKTPKPSPKINHLAYVMYTSGSTGCPKGVEVEHKGIPNMVLSQISYSKITAKSRILEFSSLHFDASVAEIFTTLLSGATLYIPLSETRSDPTKLKNYIIKNKISIATIPSSYLAIMPSFLHSSFKTLIIAGEVCSKKIMDFYYTHCHVINAYGPTEATVCVTFFDYNGTDNHCIGQAIPYIQCYVLNKKKETVQAGEIGELYICGIGLARGYRNQPGLTRKKFISWRDKHNKKVRLYRTGDRVRLLDNSLLQYIGRVDFQIKYNGIRLEPGEIEASLNQHPGVQQNVVILKKHKNQAHLIAYVIKKKRQLLVTY